MRKALAIFLRDLKRLTHNPVALVIAIGVCIIPSLYAWFNIAANWDPYKNTKDVPVAIVNEDTGAEVPDMGRLNVGDKVVEELRKNHQLGWKFTDEAQAIEGVRSGSYYAAIIIPERFTQDITSVLSGDIKKPRLQYYVNEKKNAIAPKVTDTGADTLEQTINSQFIAEVSKVVTNNTQELTEATLAQVKSGSASITRDLIDARNLTVDLTQVTDKSLASLASARTTLGSTAKSLESLKATVAETRRSLATGTGLIASTQTQAQKLQSTLNKTVTDVTDTTSQVAGDSAAATARLVGKLTQAQTQVQSTLDQLEQVVAEKQQLIDQLHKAADAIRNPTVKEGLKARIARLQDSLDAESRQIAAIRKRKAQIDAALSQLSQVSRDSHAALDATNQALRSTLSYVNGTLEPVLQGSLSDLAVSAQKLDGNLAVMQLGLAQTQDACSQLVQTCQLADKALRKTGSSIKDVRGALDRSIQDYSAIQSSQNLKVIADSLHIDENKVAQFMSSPVKIVDKVFYAVPNYGTGVAPFYTNLALWVGGFVLVAIIKLEVDGEGIGDYKPWQGYLGRWMLLNLLGQFQALICCIGDILLGIQCVSPPAFVLAGLVISFVYVNIIYALSIAFKHIGKAIAVLLVILQIPGSSGMYPIEMMPPFFQGLYPWLPFTYGIQAMRETLAGFYDGNYIKNLLVLLCFVIPSLIIGIGLRRHLLNINALFDKKLAETDMMISERVGLNNVHFRLTTIIKAVLNSEEYKRVFLERAAHFELIYPKLIKRGFVMVFVVPIALLVVLFTGEAKLPLLILWIVSLLAIINFLIVVEYLHERVNEKTDLAEMSHEQLLDLLSDQLRQEVLAFAPLDKFLKKPAADSLTTTIVPVEPAEIRNVQKDTSPEEMAAEDVSADHEGPEDRDGRTCPLAKTSRPSVEEDGNDRTPGGNQKTDDLNQER